MVSADTEPSTADAAAEATATAAAALSFYEGSAAADEAGRKVRKPYTITKSRESWTEPEHDKFLEALQLFDRDWKKIEAYVGSKTVIQIRSHAQKYFLKVQKNGTGEHLPPPRPKRKAAHPYPQKASKNVSSQPQAIIPQQTRSSPLDPAYSASMDASTLRVRSSSATALAQSWENNFSRQTNSLQDNNAASVRAPSLNNCSSSTESPSQTWLTSEAMDQDGQLPPIRVMPDFAQVYSFLGSIFDPNTSGHLQKLKEMDPIDVETILLLMRNLSVNLTSPDFESHRRLLSTYSTSTGQIKAEGADSLIASNHHNISLPRMVTSK